MNLLQCVCGRICAASPDPLYCILPPKGKLPSKTFWNQTNGVIKSKPLGIVTTIQLYSIDLLIFFFFLLLQGSQQENFKSLSFGEQSILGKYCTREPHPPGAEEYQGKKGIANTYRQKEAVEEKAAVLKATKR